MIKSVLFTLFFGFVITSTFAQTEGSNCSASPKPVTINNGGAPLTIIGKGSQLNSWTETIDGFLVKQNKQHVFEYVLKNATGKLVPSGTQAANSSLLTKSRNLFIKPNKEVITQLIEQNTEKVEEKERFPLKTTSIEIFTNTDMPTTGSIKVLCLLVDYPNMGNSYSKTDFENLLNQPNYNGTGSLKDYFLQSSFGKLDVTVDVIDWVTAPNDYEYYGNSNGYGVARELVRFAVDQAELNGIDFSQYDNDNDGDVDGIMVVHAGQGAEEGSQTQYIWSHRSRISPVVYDGKSISDYIMNPETRASSAIATVGVYCHEFGHNLGLPDLYDTDGSSQGIGNWGLMGSSAWLGGGKKPGGLSAWSKVKLGWQVPVEITTNGTYLLNPAAGNEEIFLIDPGEGKEYFLLENRQKSGVDQALPGAGLAIWHIDDARFTNSFENHKRVDVEEADGLNGLDGSSRGDAGDLYPGTSGNTAFNAVSNPNNQLYSGNINPARVLNIVQNADKTISFDADFDNIKFTPNDTIAFQPTATSQSKEKTFSLKAYNYDFTVTSVVYPDGFSGSLAAGDVVPQGIKSEFLVFFNPTIAKNYKDNIFIAGISNGVTINGEIKVKGEGLQLLFADNFETDKGWTFTGFERGFPQGLGGDPAEALEGTNVLGNVLGGTGEYINNLTDREWTATSPVFSCYGYAEIQLNYQQWLNLSNFNQDFAYLDVSIDGGITWKQILQYGDWQIRQNSWWKIMRDVSEFIAWQEDVRIRFSLGKTDASNVNGGWNIDDLLVTGKAEPYRLEANLNYGPVGIGINKSKTLIFKNGTSNNLTITSIALPLGYSTSLTTGSVISNGANSHFNILFAPLLKQPYNGMLTVEFTDGTVNYTEDIPITGVGDYIIFEDDFETLKGWLLSGGFEVGVPLGRGYDPIRAASGNNVLGTVLTGNGRYENNMTNRQWVAQSPVIDCSLFTNVHLNFARFMQIDGFYDSAYVDLSADGGATWVKVWSTQSQWIGDWQWENQSIDISTLADGKSSVAIRFSIGVTDDDWTFGGWNIDDFSLSGDTDIAIQTTDNLAFGDIAVGGSANNNILIKNLGIQDLVVTEIQYPTGFSGEAYSGTLLSGGTKNITVNFTPLDAINYNGTIEVISNAATGNSSVLVIGKGLASKIKVESVIDFGEVLIDSIATVSFSIINSGNIDLNVSNITHSNPAFSGSWSGVIAPNDTVKVPIEFIPTQPNTYTNSLQVNSDAAIGNGIAVLSGQGVAKAKHIQVSVVSLNFGLVHIDSTKTMVLDVTNTGNVELIITEINIDNPSFKPNWHSSTLAIGEAKELIISFSPTERVVFNGSIQIISDALEGDISIDLLGEGIIVLGLESELSTLQFYPNPSRGIVQVKGAFTSGVTYSIINRVGALVKKGKLSNSIDITSLPSGMYSLVVESPSKSRVVKLVVQH